MQGQATDAGHPPAPTLRLPTRWQVPADRSASYCQTHSLSLETLEMAQLMITQFVQLMRNVGYDGADCFDPSGKSDDAHLAPLDPGSTEYLLVRVCVLRRRVGPGVCSAVPTE